METHGFFAGGRRGGVSAIDTADGSDGLLFADELGQRSIGVAFSDVGLFQSVGFFIRHRKSNLYF